MNTKEQNQQVAATILQQLGGRGFLMMTGAKNLAFDGPALSFHLPSTNNKGKVKYVKIALDANDTYTFTFMGREDKKTFKVPVIKEYKGIYCDQLQEIFTNVTGLYTYL